MKKSTFSCLPLLAAALLFSSGCATSTLECLRPYPGQKSSSGNEVVGNIEASISGVYLFYYIPLWSGHPKFPNQHHYNTFTDHVRPKYMSIMLENYRKRHEYDAIEDIEVKQSSSGIWTLWIFWTRDIRSRSVAVKFPKKKDVKPGDENQSQATATAAADQPLAVPVEPKKAEKNTEKDK